MIKPNDYDTMTEYERSQLNGAGPDGILNWIIPNTMWGLCIKEESNIHDYMYMKTRTLTDKLTADVVYFLNIKDSIYKGSWFLRWLRMNRNGVYFDAVLKLGYGWVRVKRPRYCTMVHNAVDEFAKTTVLRDIESIRDEISSIVRIRP